MFLIMLKTVTKHTISYILVLHLVLKYYQNQKNSKIMLRLAYSYGVRVRYAPSPTGMLHLGNLRTALFNYLFAKKNQGKFILRIEDTDQKRSVEGAVQNIYDILKWIGIQADESPQKPGLSGPYVQTQRLHIYKDYIEQLETTGLVYKCFCSPSKKNANEQSKGNDNQNCNCLSLSKAQTSESSHNNKYALKLEMPKKQICFKDVVYGDLKFNASEMNDFVLVKQDGIPTYHLANVVDDIQMGITHVLRGQEWLTSTPKHLILYQLFSERPPIFAHLPNITGSDGKKLSKRDKSTSVKNYMESKYQPEAIVNTIALLGWVPKSSTNQIMDLGTLIKQFSIQNIHRYPAQFDIKKLNYFNKHYMKQNLIAKVANDQVRLKNFKLFMGKDLSRFSNQQICQMSDLIIKRIKTFADVQKFSYLFDSPNFNDKGSQQDKLKLLAAYNQEELQKSIQFIIQKISELGQNDDIQKALLSQNLKQSDFHILRFYLSGRTSGPNALKICKILGTKEVINRLKKYL